MDYKYVADMQQSQKRQSRKTIVENPVGQKNPAPAVRNINGCITIIGMQSRHKKVHQSLIKNNSNN